MKFKPVYIIIATVFFVLQGCQSGTELEPLPLPTTQAEVEQPVKLGDYLSITYTEYVNGQDTAAGMVMRVGIYDIASKTLSQVSDLPYTSQYPLSVYSRSDNKLYYSADVDDIGDQLFVYDFELHTTTQLTDNLFAINEIVPTSKDGPLLVVAVQKGRRNLQTGIYDEHTQELSFIDDQDTDTNTWVLSYTDNLDKAYLAQYSDEEDYNNLMRANETQTPMVPAKHTVLEIDIATSLKRTVIELEKEQILGISSSASKLFLVTSPKINKPPVEFSFVDIDTGERTMLDLQITTRSNAYLDKKESGVYLLGGSSNPSETDTRGIYYYDFVSGTLQPIFLQSEGGFINNFVMLSGE